MITGQQYALNCITTRKVLTNNEQTYKTVKLWQKNYDWKKNFDEPIFWRYLQQQVYADFSTEGHVIWNIFIIKRVPQSQFMLFISPDVVSQKKGTQAQSILVVPPWRCFLDLYIPLSHFNQVVCIIFFINIILFTWGENKYVTWDVLQLKCLLNL